MTTKPKAPEAKQPAVVEKKAAPAAKKPISKPSINPFVEKHGGKMGRSSTGRNNTSLRGGR